jgi:L-2-hydroxyglutarate oxidase LhgO
LLGTGSRTSDGGWTLLMRNRRTGEKRRCHAKFVFVGAGGHALPLLQRSGINEVKGFAGFPIGGRFLRADNRALTTAHRAKVYGAPAPGASTAVPIMLDVLQRCFANRFQAWQPALKEMVPSLGATLSDEPALYDEVFSWGTRVRGLERVVTGGASDEEERRQ